MSDIAIQVENLSKQYRLGVIGTGTLSHDLNRWWHLVRGKEDPYLKVGEANDRSTKAGSDLVWALRDINFEVKRGEVLGIIGKNGAGKSTLLKILSKVTSPTTGRIKVWGRIASLLEVGTGFHPELTGRENIFLNGAILGMTKQEISRKLDEIIDFSGCERYIDTPVKRYSSGMKVRLAFAVAAHLEPEILIVDEVLAVGDAEFQKKALGKMQEVSKGHGRTVLFVSHNMAAVKALCHKAMILQHGLIKFQGLVEEGITHYLINSSITSENDLSKRTDRYGDGSVRFLSAWVEDEYGNITDTVYSGQRMSIVAEFSTQRKGIELKTLSVAFAVSNALGDQIADLWNEGAGFFWQHVPDSGRVRCEIPKLPLNEGRYTFNICSYAGGIMADWVMNAGSINVVAGDFFGTGRLPDQSQGHFLFEQNWLVEDLCVV